MDRVTDEWLANILSYEEVPGTAHGEIYRELQRWRLIEVNLRTVPEDWGADVVEFANECLAILEGE